MCMHIHIASHVICIHYHKDHLASYSTNILLCGVSMNVIILNSFTTEVRL